MRGEGDPDVRPLAVRGDPGLVPPRVPCDRLDDREAEPAVRVPARRHPSSSVGRHAPAKPGGKPWPSSVTWISVELPAVRSGDRNRAFAVPESVVDEVAERLLEAEPIRIHLRSRWTSTVSRLSSAEPPAPPAKRAAVELASSSRSTRSTRSASPAWSVRARTSSRVLGEQHQPVGLLGSRADRCAELLLALLGRRRASSSSAFRSDSGVRSSWLASAMVDARVERGLQAREHAHQASLPGRGSRPDCAAPGAVPRWSARRSLSPGAASTRPAGALCSRPPATGRGSR